MVVILFALAGFFSTFFGGLFALRYDGRLHYILSFAAGVLIGVVSFDVLPEIFELADQYQLDTTPAMIAFVAGFLVFHSLGQFMLVHHADEKGHKPRRHPHVGKLSAAALAMHSFIDGIGIGLAFQVSMDVGVIVAIAVIAHDFCDGMNTVSLMLLNKNTKKWATRMLVLDAVAPVLGAASTLAFQLPPEALLIFLGFFAGFLLYISASDILPEAHLQAPAARTAKLIALTCLGAVFIFLIVHAMAH